MPKLAPRARREMRFRKTGEGREEGEEVFQPIMRQGKIKCRLGEKKRRKTKSLLLPLAFVSVKRRELR